MPIATHYPEHQEALIHNQRGAHQVAVDGVASRTAPGLDLHKDAQLVVHGVDLVSDALAPLVAEEHRPPDLVGAMLATLHIVAELEEPWRRWARTLSLLSPSTVAESINGRAADTTSRSSWTQSGGRVRLG